MNKHTTEVCSCVCVSHLCPPHTVEFFLFCFLNQKSHMPREGVGEKLSEERDRGVSHQVHCEINSTSSQNWPPVFSFKDG